METVSVKKLNALLSAMDSILGRIDYDVTNLKLITSQLTPGIKTEPANDAKESPVPVTFSEEFEVRLHRLNTAFDILHESVELLEGLYKQNE